MIIIQLLKLFLQPNSVVNHIFFGCDIYDIEAAFYSKDQHRFIPISGLELYHFVALGSRPLFLTVG